MPATSRLGSCEPVACSDSSSGTDKALPRASREERWLDLAANVRSCADSGRNVPEHHGRLAHALLFYEAAGWSVFVGAGGSPKSQAHGEERRRRNFNSRAAGYG